MSYVTRDVLRPGSHTARATWLPVEVRRQLGRLRLFQNKAAPAPSRRAPGARVRARRGRRCVQARRGEEGGARLVRAHTWRRLVGFA